MDFGVARMSDKQAAKWEKKRVKGKRHFVIFSGVLGWGLFMFVCMTTFTHLQQASFDIQLLSGISPVIVMIHLPLWTMAGLAFGLLTWHGNEKLYHKTIQHKQYD